jgi:hypothetical protein
MPVGPGKYDDLATLVREQADAKAVVVIVLGGTAGSGFSVQSVEGDISARLPALLRMVADEIATTHAPRG